MERFRADAEATRNRLVRIMQMHLGEPKRGLNFGKFAIGLSTSREGACRAAAFVASARAGIDSPAGGLSSLISQRVNLLWLGLTPRRGDVPVPSSKTAPLLSEGSFSRRER